jgi:hypothetical protein
LKGHKFLLKIVLVIFISSYMISCSGGSGADKKLSGESIDSPGASVGALGFKDAYPIELQMQEPTGEFVTVQDGQYIEPGKKRLAVTVQGDTSDIDKVLLSDGGVYQVEAVKQGDSYQADFTFDNDRLYTTVLVQALHKNQRASKEKIVFKTFKDDSEGKMILNGIGMVMSNDLLNGNTDLLASELDSFVKEAFEYIRTQESGIISSLSYGNNSSTLNIEVIDFKAIHNALYPSAIIHLAFIIHDVDLTAINIKGQDLITTKDNDLNADMYVALEDTRGDGKRGLVFNLLGSPRVSFQKDFFLRPIIEEKIASGLKVIERPPLVADLQSIFKALGNSLPLNITVNNSTVDLISLFDKQRSDLSKYLFIDLYGIPEDTSSGVLALGAGLYIAKDMAASAAPSQKQQGTSPDLDGIIVNLCQTMADKAFENIKQQYQGLISNLSYGDNNSQTPDFVINSLSMQDTANPKSKMIQADFTIKDVDLKAASLFGFSLINTQDNDLTIEATFLLTANVDGGGGVLVMDVQQVSKVTFSDAFLGKRVVEELAKNTIANLDNFTTNIDTIVSVLDLDIDLSGSGTQGPEFPYVLETLSPYDWDLRLPDGDNLSLAISQDNINWVLAQLFTRGFEWDIYEILTPILGSDFAGFNKNSSDKQETIMRFSVPPVLALSPSQIRIQADDVFLEYRLNDEPQWEASIDLDFILDVRVVNNELAFFIIPNTEKCRFHIMKDNFGNLGIFDHSNLVNDIIIQLPVILGNSTGGPIFTCGLKAFEPLVVLNSLDNPINISAGDGYLYIDMNALDVDLSLLKGVLVAPL